METEPIIIKSNPKRKWKRWILRIIYLIIFLLLLIDFFLFFLATPILKTFLQNKVTEQTKGLFSVNFKRVSIELGTRRLALEEFELIPDTSVYNQLVKNNKTKAALYSINCKSIALGRINLYQLFSKSKLSAKNLKLIRPVVELKKLPGNVDPKSDTRDFVHEDLFPALEPYLSEIKINTISLENGRFFLSLKKDSTKTTTHFGFVSINLYQFLLNKKEFTTLKKLFYSNEIQISIEDYKINLSDNIHYVYADAINISSKNAKLLATNVGINTINQSNSYIRNLKSNYYRISSPQIEFSNFDIYNLYFNNDIQIGNVLCKEPSIKLVNILKKKTEEADGINKSLEIDLSKLIKGKLNSINVDTFRVEKGKLQFYYDSWFVTPSYQANSISVELFNFQLDERANTIKSKIFYSDNINFLIDTFIAVLPDKTHSIHVGQIAISSKEKTIGAIDIRMKKNKTSDSSVPNSLDISVPSLNISGSDFYKLYHERIFNVSRLAIGKSNIDIQIPKSNAAKEGNKPRKNILTIITSNFLKQLNIAQFVLNESTFKITSFENDSSFLTYQGRSYFDLSSFSISESILSSDSSNLFYCDQFNLKLYNYSQDLRDQIHIMQSNSLEISTKDSLIELTGFTIKPKKEIVHGTIFNSKNRIFNFYLIQAFIKNIDINKAFRDSILEAGSISIFRPSINIDNYFQPKINIVLADDSTSIRSIDIVENRRKKSPKSDGTFRGFLASYLKKVNVQALTVENANVNMSDIDSLGRNDLVMSAKVSAKLNKFYFDTQNVSETDSIYYSDNISFRLTDYFGKFANKKYQLKIKQASFSSRDSVFLASLVRFFPTDEYSNSGLSNKFWSFYAPVVQTNNIRTGEFLDFNILDLGSLKIANPAIVLTTNSKEPIKPSRNVEDSVKRKLNFKKIKFDQIEVKNGVFGILTHELNIDKLRLNTKVDLHAKNIELDSTIFSDPSTFFENLSAIVDFKDAHYQLNDSLKSIDIKRIEIDTDKDIINGNSFKYNNIGGFSNVKGNADLKEVNIPAFNLTDFKLEKLVLHKELNSSGLYLSRPSINIFRLNKPGENKSFKLADINLYEKIRKSLNAIDINDIIMDSASISISKLESSEPKTTVFEKVYANISKLLIDSMHQNDQRILSTDNISVGIKDYGFDFSEDLYTLYVRDMGFSTKSHSFFANSINLNPNTGREEYAIKRQKETNLNYLKAESVVANGVNFVDIIDNKQLKVNNVDITGVQFQAFKNKQYPLDSVIKVALPLGYLYKSKNLIKIDSIKLHDSYFGYEMLGKNAIETGILDFTNINASITNLTNDPVAIASNEKTVFKASGYFLDKALLSASIHFPLGSKYGEYVYGGTLDTIDMKELNPLVENLYFISIKDGQVNNINFTINANDDYAVGKLRMDYKDLKIELINKKKSDSLVVENRGLFSMVANSIIRDSNPKRKFGYFKEGKIYFERNIYKPVFNYWSAAPLSGVQATLGFKSKQLKERLKIEKGSNKLAKKHIRKVGRIDKKTNKNLEKQIQKELKDEGKNRKKEQKKGKRLQKIKPIPVSSIRIPLNGVFV